MNSESKHPEADSQPALMTIESEIDTITDQAGDASSNTDSDTAPEMPRRNWRRNVFLTVGPLLLAAVGSYLYITGDRYVETDNAYIKADKVSLSAQVSGAITDVLVEENAHVVKGQALFRIDAVPFQVALTRAQARLLAVRAFLTGLKANYQKNLAELKRDEIDQDYKEREYNRQLGLSRSKLSSPAELDKSKHEMEMARQQIAITRQALDQIAAQLGGNPDLTLEDHPFYKEVQGSVDDAMLNINRTVVVAPYTGVAQKKPQPGQYVRAGEPVMVIVAETGMWIEANYKETELTYVRPGQPVRIRIDTYPDREWHGTVTSLSQASGAEFSLLPPQNATGNWVKVVQRIPLRITIESWEGTPVLRAGMSTTVRIDTRHHRALPEFLQVPLSWLGLNTDTDAAGSE